MCQKEQEKVIYGCFRIDKSFDEFMHTIPQ